jgi:hypothetical protein
VLCRCQYWTAFPTVVLQRPNSGYLAGSLGRNQCAFPPSVYNHVMHCNVAQAKLKNARKDTVGSLGPFEVVRQVRANVPIENAAFPGLSDQLPRVCLLIVSGALW